MGLLAEPLAPTENPLVYVPPASQTVSPGRTQDQLIWSVSPQALLHVVPPEAQGLARVPGAPLATNQLLPVCPRAGPPSTAPPSPPLPSPPPSAPPPESAPAAASGPGLASSPVAETHPLERHAPSDPIASAPASGALERALGALEQAAQAASATVSARLWRLSFRT